jgi:glycerol-3-phosphate dehydrogenase
MTRATAALGSRTFDLLIVGAGVYGAALAYEACQRGYSVAVVDRGDFGSGTSSNSLKILHGGLRYLQQLNLPRMRSSIRARRDWAQLAPAFIEPLACAVATQGWGRRSVAALSAGLLVNEVVSFDRNSGLSDRLRLPAARLLSREEYAAVTQGLLSTHSRGALWWDALALNTERLVLELLMRAADMGAQLANYVEAKELVTQGGTVHGVKALDLESNSHIDIQATRVICTGGSLASGLLDGLPGTQLARRTRCTALNLIVGRKMPTNIALALSAPDGGRPGRGDLFFVPWRGRTMVGTHYFVAGAQGTTPEGSRAAVDDFLGMIQSAAPQWDIRHSDITFIHRGDLPMDPRWRAGQPPVLSSEAEVLDGGREFGIAGLWLVNGPKFTTAQEVAKFTLARIQGQRWPSIPAKADRVASTQSLQGLLAMDAEKDLVAKARLAARHTHAAHLADVVLRRTDCGASGYPGDADLEACAKGMGHELNWSQSRMAAEISAVQQNYRDWHFWKPPQ